MSRSYGRVMYTDGREGREGLRWEEMAGKKGN